MDIEHPSTLGSDGFDYVVWVRKLPCLEFGVNLLSVNTDLESTTTRRNELERTNVLFELQKLFRQTDGLRLVVSSSAIFNCYLQAHILQPQDTLGETFCCVKER